MKKLAVIGVIFAGLFWGLGATQLQAQDNTSEEVATINITEYSDYQCPACAYFHPIVQKLKQKYGDQIEVNYKYYPLNSHRYAALAARAAQAAKNQDKFLPMHNKLFENQKQWSNSGNPAATFVNYARDLNLDIEQFKDDLNAAETQKTVMQERKEGRRKGVNATPTFFIEGEKVQQLPRTFAEFDQLVQQYLSKKKKSE